MARGLRAGALGLLGLVLACAARVPPAAEPPSVEDRTAHVRESRAFAAELGLGPLLAQRHLNETLTKADERVIRAVQGGGVHAIAGLAFERASAFAVLAHVPDDAVAYALVDEEELTVRPVAWHDASSGEVVEVNTGYRLRVLDDPGLGTRVGDAGEKLFVYGYGWYERWNRILPEPVIAQLDAFYDAGIAHVRAKLLDYKTVANPKHSGGDLQLVTWDEALLGRMSRWGKKLPAAPYVHLPDSGTVDVRRERFERAVADGHVVVDQTSLEAYRAAERTILHFGTVPSEAEIKKRLLAPFRKPELFSLADQAILLDAAFEGEGPLRLVIDASVGGGFFVPDNGHKEVHVAYSEVDLNFRYNGLIFAKLAHEAHHVIEFRQRPFLAERCWHHRDDVIETLKYLNEFMWWVQHYPGDAPNWDWAPINAGIVLASLLAGYFPNSRC